MNKWISVNEFLPPFHDKVLIHVKNTTENPDIAVGYFETDGDFYFYIGKETVENVEAAYVTHWMRLPPIPEEFNHEF